MAAAGRDLDAAIEEYLAYLRVERGLADATLRAYRADLADFAMSRGAVATWADGPDVAVRYLAARGRRGRPGAPGLAPTSLRRRTASIRGFYRFAYGDGLIGSDVAAHRDLHVRRRRPPEMRIERGHALQAVERHAQALGEGVEIFGGEVAPRENQPVELVDDAGRRHGARA